jgi:DNA-3-methyladenine glycosylase I
MLNALIKEPDGIARCGWACGSDAYSKYHDEEWGVPTRDDRWIFEKICLEGFQSGLSWLTILNKRENFRKAFANFEIEKVSRFDSRHVDQLMKDTGIIRHRGKIESTINNAKRALEMKEEFGSLAAFFWKYERRSKVPPMKSSKVDSGMVSKTAESTELSKELKRRGWGFTGPTTAYAFMQASGIVNDHMYGCEARGRCKKLRTEFKVPKPK